MTRGGDAFRSTTESRLSGTIFFGSAGSTFVDDVMRARLSSGVMATLSGGPTTLPGTSISASTLGGNTPRSMIVAVSGAGLAGSVLTPLTSTALLSFDDTAICASMGPASASAARSAAGTRDKRREVVG